KRNPFMSKKSRSLRSSLMTGASTAFIATLGVTAAQAADPLVEQTSTNSISVEQNFNDFNDGEPATTVALESNSEGTVSAEINNSDPANYALQDSTVTVGSAGDGNISSATGFANSADLTVDADLNNVVGSGLATVTASSNSIVDGASVVGMNDIGAALSQQNIQTTASATDSTDFGISIDNGATGSTAQVVGNQHGATGVLNIGTTALNSDANNSSGSASAASAQSSVDATLTASVTSVDSFATGSGVSGTALNGSTVRLSGNSQTATGVANSG